MITGLSFFNEMNELNRIANRCSNRYFAKERRLGVLRLSQRESDINPQSRVQPGHEQERQNLKQTKQKKIYNPTTIKRFVLEHNAAHEAPSCPSKKNMNKYLFQWFDPHLQLYNETNTEDCTFVYDP